MQIEAIYDHGRITLPEHIRLRHQRFKVRLDIPDHEVAADESNPAIEQSKPELPPVDAAAGSIRARIESILGPYKTQLKSAKVDTKALWREHLEEKHLGRR